MLLLEACTELLLALDECREPPLGTCKDLLLLDECKELLPLEACIEMSTLDACMEAFEACIELLLLLVE